MRSFIYPLSAAQRTLSLLATAAMVRVISSLRGSREIKLNQRSRSGDFICAARNNRVGARVIEHKISNLRVDVESSNYYLMVPRYHMVRIKATRSC